MNFLRTTNSGYIFDRRFFWGAEIIMILGLVILFASFSFDFAYHPYFNCIYSTCANPMYNGPGIPVSSYTPPIINKIFPSLGKLDCDWCNLPTLSKGTYGKPPPSKYLFFFVPIVVILLFGLAVLVNHLVWNKGKKFDLGIKEQYKFLQKVKIEDEKK